MTVKLDRYDGLNRTPGIALALRANLELIEAGQSVPALLIGWDHKNIVASHDGVPVGILTFVHQDWLKEVDIGVGYVLPEYRGRGCYRALWNELVTWARELKAVEIVGNTHMDNVSMRAVAKSFGRSEAGVLLRFPLTPGVDR